MAERHSPPRIFYRYVSGRLLDGRTNGGGYLSPGVGRTRWGRAPGWHRQAWRLGIPGALLAGHAAYVAHPAATEAGASAAAAIAAVHGARAARRAWRSRRFRRMYTRPVLGALAPALGDAPIRLHIDPGLGSLLPRLARPMSPAERRLREWYGEHLEPAVRWLPDRIQLGLWALQRWARPATRHLDQLRRPGPEQVGPRIELRAAVPYLTPDQRLYIGAVIGAKIPAGELVESWDQVGPHVTATWTVRKRPPASCGYADLNARLGGLAEWEFFLGLGAAVKSVTISLKDDSPHVAISAASGAGKSVLAQLIGLQILARGGELIILDIKGSHRWAWGLPGVTYCTSPGQIHEAMVRAGKLAGDRNDRAFTEPEGWDPGPRVGIILEEINSTIDLLQDYWAEARDKSDPKKSPAVQALKRILTMGRSAKVNVIGIAQMLTARSIGGPEARENFAVRCLARYTKNAWKMLVPQAAMPRVSRTLGRWQIVVGDTATECQVCYLTPAEARMLLAKVSPGTHTPLIGADQDLSPGHDPSGDNDTAADPLSEAITLREAAARGVVPWKAPAAKKRLQRARAKDSSAAPKPVGKDGQADTYRVGDLIVWAERELGVATQSRED